MKLPTTFYIAIQSLARSDDFAIINETHLGGRHHSTTFDGFMNHSDWDEPPFECIRIRIDLDDGGFKATSVIRDVAERIAEWSFDNPVYRQPEWIDFYEANGVSDYWREPNYSPRRSETLGGSALI